MAMEWVVAAVVLLAGVVAAAGLYLGLRDPSTQSYAPRISGLFTLGRTAVRPEHGENRDKDAAGGEPKAGKP